MPYTEVDGAGGLGSETIALPALSSGSTGNYNGVVIADSPTYYAAGQLTPLYTYESAFGVRQVDGYMYPSPALGVTTIASTTAGALDGTSGTLTAAGLAAFTQLKGTIPFDTGRYGYAATAVAGANYTPFLTDASGNALAGVYVHPTNAADPQGGVSELSLYFDYNSNDLQWELLAPGLINWVTQNTHRVSTATTSARTSTICFSPTTSGARSTSAPRRQPAARLHLSGRPAGRCPRHQRRTARHPDVGSRCGLRGRLGKADRDHLEPCLQRLGVPAVANSAQRRRRAELRR